LKIKLLPVPVTKVPLKNYGSGV